jgi:hypothetical protein
MAVIIGLASTGSVSAVPTLLVTLDADSPTTGSLFITPTSEGNITFSGTYSSFFPGDPEMNAVPVRGATGDTFDIYGPGVGVQWAELEFEFDVHSLVDFVYGGNLGNISIIAYDINGNELDSFFQALTAGPAGPGAPAGPITLTRTPGAAIRSLRWTDTDTTYTGFAVLDNIDVMIDNVIPAPSALVLAGIGIGFVGGWRKRKTA